MITLAASHASLSSRAPEMAALIVEAAIHLAKASGSISSDALPVPGVDGSLATITEFEAA